MLTREPSHKTKQKKVESSLPSKKTLPSRSDSDGLAFISYNGPRLPKDAAVRDLIRRSAMKHTATIRKQTGGYVKLSVRRVFAQVERPELLDQNVHSSSPQSSLVDTAWDESNVDGAIAQFATSVIAIPNEATQCYGLVRPPIHDAYGTGKVANFWMLNLINPLTVHHLGISTLSCFRPEMDCIGKTLGNMPSSAHERRLLSFIPSLYGHVPSVTYATDCIIARLQQLIRVKDGWSTSRDVASLKPYTKALTALQVAIDDQSLRTLPETLCAVQLLGIFELLHGGSLIKCWMHHAGGASRLIEFRGPDRFQTDFELSLLMAHAGPIVMEAFLTGKRCFLQDDRWQRVLETAILKDPIIPKDQTHLVISLWVSLGRGPNLLQDVKEFIFESDSSSTQKREDIIQRVLREHQHLEQWLIAAEQYQNDGAARKWHTLSEGALELLQSLCTSQMSEQPMAWHLLVGTFMLVFLVKLRLLYALAPVRFAELETTCQKIANGVMLITLDKNSYKGNRLMGGLFMSQTLWMSKSVLATRSSWEEESLCVNSRQGLQDSRVMEKWKFEQWIQAITDASQVQMDR